MGIVPEFISSHLPWKNKGTQPRTINDRLEDIKAIRNRQTATQDPDVEASEGNVPSGQVAEGPSQEQPAAPITSDKVA